MISLVGYLYIEVAASALIAGWVVVRFPGRGPTRVSSALAVLLVALLVGAGGPAAIPLTMRLPHGLYVTLLGLILPVFFVMTLAIAWLVRSIALLVGGSGGGGHPIRAAGR